MQLAAPDPYPMGRPPSASAPSAHERERRPRNQRNGRRAHPPDLGQQLLLENEIAGQAVESMHDQALGFAAAGPGPRPGRGGQTGCRSPQRRSPGRRADDPWPGTTHCTALAARPIRRRPGGRLTPGPSPPPASPPTVGPLALALCDHDPPGQPCHRIGHRRDGSAHAMASAGRRNRPGPCSSSLPMLGPTRLDLSTTPRGV